MHQFDALAMLSMRIKVKGPRPAKMVLIKDGAKRKRSVRPPPAGKVKKKVVG